MKSKLNVETSRRHSSTSLPPPSTTSTTATRSVATRSHRRLGRAQLPLLALLALALTVPVLEASAQPQEPPQVQTGGYFILAVGTVDFYGTLWFVQGITAVWFDWGTSTNYGNSSFCGVDWSGDFHATAGGFSPGTTYHYRAAASNDYGTGYGGDQSFTFIPPGAGPPSVTTLPATDITTNSAALNGTANSNFLPTTAWFQWGATTSYGNLTTATNMGSGGTLSAQLAGLTPGATYHFQAVASNVCAVVYGSDQSFTPGLEFTYTTNNGALTITEYTGPGGAVTIPDTIYGLPVTSIGDSAFYQCASVTSVTIPNSVISIGASAFEGTHLTSVTIPNSITSIGGRAFMLCTNLTTARIGNSVTSIGDYAFDYCTSLTSVTIPSSVTDIGPGAFGWCTSLTSVTIPNSVTSIGDWAFSACISLAAITVDTLNPAYCSVDGVLFDKGQTTVIQCPGRKAGSYAIPNSVTTIGDSAFDSCSDLTNITIPNSVTTIGIEAFGWCTSLTSVTIPNSVTNIGSDAFDRCYSLTNVTIPNSVTSIGGQTFQLCTSLISVTIPNRVTYIGSYMFIGCSSLTTVIIPNSVTGIGDYAFFGCDSLTGVYFQGNAPSLGMNVFEEDNNVTVYSLWSWSTTFGGRPTALWPPPTIQTSPQIQTAEAGSVVGLRVNASSLLPLFYFWYLKATNLLSSGTNWQLNLPNVQLSQSGAYTVVISNASGAVTSAPALLNVIAAVERRCVPGVKATGEAGSLLNVDYADSLSSAPNWTPLGSASLTGTSQYWFDLTLPLPPQRFYRAWQTGTPGVMPSLDLHLVPAITLTGTIGHSVRLDYINQFGPTDAWVTLATVPLTNTSQLYFDTSSINQPARLYRVVQVP